MSTTHSRDRSSVLPSSTSMSLCDQRWGSQKNPSPPLPQFHPPADGGIYIALGLWESVGIQPAGADGDSPDTFSCCCPAISVPSTGGLVAPNRKACLVQGTQAGAAATPVSWSKGFPQPAAAGAACEWAACQQAAGIRGMLNCRAVHFGGLRHMTLRQER